MKAPSSGAAAAAGAASLLFLLVSPFFTPTITNAFTASPSLFVGVETRRHTLSRSSSSSFHVSPRSLSTSSRSRNRWAPSSPAVRRAAAGASGEGGDGDGDGFSFSDLQRELSRRRVEDAMAPDTQQQQQQQQKPLPGAEGREAFMEEQMASFLPGCACLRLSCYVRTIALSFSFMLLLYCLHNARMLSAVPRLYSSRAKRVGCTSTYCSLPYQVHA